MMQRYFVIQTLTLIWVCSSFCSAQQIQFDSLWEADIRKFEHLDSTETYSSDAILFVGSSSIRLWITLAEDMVPYPVIQRGYGGAKLSDLVVYAERIIYPHNCRAVVLFVANDITGSIADISPPEAASLVNDIIQIIRRKMKDIPLFYIATTPTPLRWTVWQQISEANERIKNLCENSENVYFIETAFAFLDEDGLPISALFRNDSLHLNEKGYQVWNGIIKKELVKVLGD